MYFLVELRNMDYKFDLEIVSDFNSLIGNPFFKEKVFVDTLSVYKNYLIIGCNYLSSNRDTIEKMMSLLVPSPTKILSNPNPDSDPDILLAIALEKPEAIKLIYIVCAKYKDKICKLVDLLWKHRDSLLKYLRTNHPEGDLSVNTTDNKITEVSSEVSSEVPSKSPFEGSLYRDTLYFDNLTCDKIQQFGTYARENPNKDKIVYLKHRSGKRAKSDVYISGSTALKDLISILSISAQRGKIAYPLITQFNPRDTDFYRLKCKSKNLFRYASVDLVDSTFDCIEDLLLSFDLPCCRVAIDDAENFYVSYHCLSAIFFGKMYMPTYTKEQKTLQEMYSKNVKTGSEIGGTIIRDWICKHHRRCTKYRERGFEIEYFDTDEVMPFIKNVEPNDTYY